METTTFNKLQFKLWSYFVISSFNTYLIRISEDYATMWFFCNLETFKILIATAFPELVPISFDNFRSFTFTLFNILHNSVFETEEKMEICFN